jgi:Ala-tRNA(Pro) deacylase
MPAKKVKEFLDKNKVKYVSIKHSPAFTSLEVAESTHIPGKNFAKTVIVKIDNKLAMAVLPAKYLIDLDLLKEVVKADFVELANENEFENFFPGCEIGAMPPFGNLYNMEVFVADVLTRDEEIAFNAGTHTEVIKMAYKDFEKLVMPKIIQLSLK